MNNQSNGHNKKIIFKDLINNTQGKFFAVKFTKKNGQERLMTAKAKINYNGVGGKNTTAHLPHYITVYEFGKHPKNVNLDTVSEIRMNKKIFKLNSNNEVDNVA